MTKFLVTRYTVTVTYSNIGKLLYELQGVKASPVGATSNTHLFLCFNTTSEI